MSKEDKMELIKFFMMKLAIFIAIALAIKFRDKELFLAPYRFGIIFIILLHFVKNDDLRAKLASYFFMIFFPYGIYILVSVFVHFPSVNN